MNAGFEAVTDSGVILIDGNYSNLKLVRLGVSHQVPWGDLSPAGKYYYMSGVLDISCPSGQPIVFVRPRNCWCSTSLSVNTASAGGHTLIQTAAPTPGGGELGFFPVEYAVFDSVGASVDLQGVGLQVFRADGSIAYDSNFRSFEVVQVSPFGDWGSVIDTEQFIDHVSAPDAWYLLGVAHGGVYENLENGQNYWAPMFRQATPTRMAYSMHGVNYSSGYRVADSNGTSAVFALITP